jgi:hypothetical protein
LWLRYTTAKARECAKEPLICCRDILLLPQLLLQHQLAYRRLATARLVLLCSLQTRPKAGEQGCETARHL